MAGRDSRPPTGLGASPPGPDEPSLGTRVASVAHEINNPITYVLGNLADLQQLALAMREAIAGYGEWARAAGEADRADALEEKIRQAGGVELIEELAGDALEGAERIRALAKELVSLARGADAPGAQVETFDLCEVVQAGLRLFARDLPPDLHVERTLAGRCRVRGDRGQLGQVLTNLLQNARDACTQAAACAPSGGHVISVHCESGADGVHFWVEDSGPGVPEADVEHIFERFFTTKGPGRGTGLGLFISRGLIEGIGGRLTYGAAPGGGSRFRIWLPSVDDPEDG